MLKEQLKFINEDLSNSINIYYEKGKYSFEQNRKDATLFKKILPKEECIIYPDNIVKIGRLDFLLMRFNVGVVSEIGIKSVMEDDYIVLQNLNISFKFACSLFCIIDGFNL